MPKRSRSNARPRDPHDLLRPTSRFFLAMLAICAVSWLVSLTLLYPFDFHSGNLTPASKAATLVFQLTGWSTAFADVGGLALGYTFWTVRSHLEALRTHIYVGAASLVAGHVVGVLWVLDVVRQVCLEGAGRGGTTFFITSLACPILLIVGFGYLLVGACYFALRRSSQHAA